VAERVAVVGRLTEILLWLPRLAAAAEALKLQYLLGELQQRLQQQQWQQ
jgi:hypothetical protein